MSIFKSLWKARHIKYQPSINTLFEFVSTGTKTLVKHVSFDEVEDHVYNLALGTVLDDGSVSYNDRSNNGDMVKVFTTVVQCVKNFAEKHPDDIIYFQGDTEQKTRIYNEILSRYYDEFSSEFGIFGIAIRDGRIDVRKFTLRKKFSGFYLRKKTKRHGIG